jgi:WD40 repeat protein
MRTTFPATTFGLLAVTILFGCGPGVHEDPTLLATGGQGSSPPPQVQELTPIDMTPYDPQPGKTFHPCGTLGEGQSESSAYSLDGTLFAMGFSSGVVKIYRTSDLALVATFPKASTAITSVQFSPDGALLASASSDDPAVEVWKVADGTTVSRMPSAAFHAHLKFSANGQYLGLTNVEFFAYPTHTARNMISLRTVADGKETCQISDAVLLSFSADGSTAWVVANETVTAYAVQTCSVASDSPAVTVGGGTPFAMSPDGQMVFKYYDAATGQTPTLSGLPLISHTRSPPTSRLFC